MAAMAAWRKSLCDWFHFMVFQGLFILHCTEVQS